MVYNASLSLFNLLLYVDSIDMVRSLSFLVAAGAGAVGIAVMLKWRSQGKRPAIVITELWCYPVKSCGGYSLKTATLQDGGFEYDRTWAVFRREDKAVLSQREFPKMKHITAAIRTTGGCVVLELSHPDHGSVQITATSTPNPDAFAFQLWGINGKAKEEPEGTRWIQTCLGSDEVLLGKLCTPRHPVESAEDSVVAKESDRCNLQDFSSLHIITEESLAQLKHEIGDDTLTVARFRPNIVVKGVPAAEENEWKRLRVGGGNILRVAKLCGRCSIPTIDESLKRSPEFLPTSHLRKTRSVRQTHREKEDEQGPEPIFGLNVFSEMTPATLAVGDSVEVLESSLVRYE